MGNWLQVIGQLALWQKLIVAAIILVIVATWLAVCLVLAGVFGPAGVLGPADVLGP